MRNVRTKLFREMLSRLPQHIQKLAVAAFKTFLRNPDDPSLARHVLADTKKGRHRKNSAAVSVSRRYRAIYCEDGETNVWYWIGSHEDYNNFVGKI